MKQVAAYQYSLLGSGSDIYVLLILGLMAGISGWFIGWLDQPGSDGHVDRTTWFVVRIEGEGILGPEARNLAIRLLDEQAAGTR